jgi:hypothetical protein
MKISGLGSAASASVDGRIEKAAGSDLRWPVLTFQQLVLDTINFCYKCQESKGDIIAHSVLDHAMSRILSQLRRIGLLAVCAFALLQTSAHAQLTIEITGAGANRIPVAIAEFGGDPAASGF